MPLGPPPRTPNSDPFAGVPPPPEPLPVEGFDQEWSPTGAIGVGWELIKKTPEAVAVIFVAALVGNALSIAGSIADIAILGLDRGSDERTPLGWILEIANIPFSLWTSVGIISYCLRIARREPAGFGHVFSAAHWGLVLPYLGGSILAGLCILVGLVFLIVPGIYLALGWFFWSWFLVDGRGVMESLRASWTLCDGKRWALLGFALLLGLLNIGGLLACCVGVILTIAITQMAMAWSYVRLTQGLAASSRRRYGLPPDSPAIPGGG